MTERDVALTEMKSHDFEIGEVTCFKVCPKILFQVLERVESTCHGGTQLFYRGRLASPNSVGNEIIQVSCIELAEIKGSLGPLRSTLRIAFPKITNEAIREIVEIVKPFEE